MSDLHIKIQKENDNSYLPFVFMNLSCLIVCCDKRILVTL